MPVRFFSDSRCLEHRVPRGYPERPDRLRSLVEAVQSAELELVATGTHARTDSAIRDIHAAEYVERFEAAVAAGDLFLDTGDNPLSAGTFEAATGAVDACLAAADWAFAQAGRRAITLVRPPGHHAERAMAMGFCYFNNIAVTASYLLREQGVSHLAIVDFDVHHGNGTQHAFEDRSDVFFASLHQFPFYPGTGAEQERGRGEGLGATLNVPLSAGSDDDVYRKAFQELVLPALRDFDPRFLLVSAGFDVGASDPIGGMRVSNDAFRQWGRWLGEIAGELCEGRVLATLEGGYDIAGLPEQLLSFTRGLAES